MSTMNHSVRSSSTTSTTSDSAPKKKFACSWPKCGKSFSRSEHLHRHALNHKEGSNTCSRCSAHFRRRDLLDRHMARHKEKDDEAGGEGLGHLATRKRLWRDGSGNIVNARRPYQQDGPKRRQLTSSEERKPPGESPRSIEIAAAPPSPPTSIPSTGSSRQNVHLESPADQLLLQDPWPPMDPALLATSETDQFDFLCNASWGAQPYPTFMGASSDLPYDDIFKPDTAMSFNAPFTTQNYYTWLFENEGVTPETASQGRGGPPAQNMNHEAGVDTAVPSPESLDPHLLAQHSNFSQEAGFLLSGPDVTLEHHLQLHNQEFHSSVQQSSQMNVPPQAGQSCIDGQLDYSFTQDDQTNFTTDFENSAIQSLFSSSHMNESTFPTETASSTPPSQRSASLSSHPLPDAYTARYGSKLPTVTNEARDGLMQIISQNRPKKPDGTEINSSDPLLSLISLQHYSDLFFTRFNSSYPLIHQATFRSSNTHTFLLMAILLLGATYSDKEAHMLAVCIHDIMRPLIHASPEFGTRPKLWMLQTILLVECFGKSRAGQNQHDMSHLYHGLLINLIRRSDCQSACIPAYDEHEHDLEEYWLEAVEAEQKRRLALLCFMWDTQHAVLFSQSLCMNASELKITLPWDPALWHATSASEWQLLTQSTPPPPSYLTILKSYTNPTPNMPVPHHLNALSRVLILHGLMSISWDLGRRDQTSCGLSQSIMSWRDRISTCYTGWRTDFDSYTSSVLSSLSFSPLHAAKFQRFTVAHMAVYHTAQLILQVDIIDLQIVAGARHIIGRPVTGTDKARSRRRIEEWIERDGGERAARAASHAGWLFRDGVRKLENWNVDEMFHYPWCLYLATLMCWVFHSSCTKSASIASSAHTTSTTTNNTKSPTKTSAPTTLDTENDDDEDSDWDARAEMNALISALTRLDDKKESFVPEMWKVGSKWRTGGLVRCMVKQLNTVRWAVVREGMIVLRGLVE